MKHFALVFLLAACGSQFVSAYHHSWYDGHHWYNDYHLKGMMDYKNWSPMGYDADYSIPLEFVEAFQSLPKYASFLKDAEFNKRAQYFYDHYFKFYTGKPYHYGDYQSADMAYHPGLKAAYDAYKYWMRSYYPKEYYSEYYGYPAAKEEAYTPEQVFMITYVNMYYSKYQPESFYGKSYTPAPKYRYGFGPSLYMPKNYYHDYYHY